MVGILFFYALFKASKRSPILLQFVLIPREETLLKGKIDYFLFAYKLLCGNF